MEEKEIKLKKKRIKFSDNLIYIIIVIIVIFMLFLGNQGKEEIDVLEEDIEVVEIIEEGDEVIEIVEEEEEALAYPKVGNIINIGSKVLLYYDFSEREFVSNRQPNSDIFSKRYAKHFVFTRFNPVNIKAIDKGIDKVEKEDCVGVIGQFEWLYSGQSLCVITKENNIVALGGTWGDTLNAELSWKTFP